MARKKSGKVGKITNPKMQTQERPASRPASGGLDQNSRPLTAREIAEYKRKQKSKKG